MLRSTLLFISALFVSLAASGGATVDWVETTHDFGAINEDGGPVTCELKFINRGDKPVAVIGASASCGCTTPRYDRASVAPGDTGIVKVTFDPDRRPGRFTKKVNVDISDGEGDPLHSSLLVKGVVVGASSTIRARFPIEAGPLRLRTSTAAFGEVYKNKQITTFIEAYNPSSDTIRPHFGETSTGFAGRMVDPVVPPGEQGTLLFIFNSDRNPLYGLVTDTITFYGSADAEPITIDLVALVRENFSRMTPQAKAKAPVIKLDPYTIDLGTVSRSAGVLKASFEIANRGDDPLIVRRVYTTDPGVTVVATPDKVKRGKCGVVTLEIDPSQITDDLLNARLQVISNDPQQSIQSVRIAAILKD